MSRAIHIEGQSQSGIDSTWVEEAHRLANNALTAGYLIRHWVWAYLSDPNLLLDLVLPVFKADMSVTFAREQILEFSEVFDRIATVPGHPGPFANEYCHAPTAHEAAIMYWTDSLSECCSLREQWVHKKASLHKAEVEEADRIAFEITGRHTDAVRWEYRQIARIAKESNEGRWRDIVPEVEEAMMRLGPEAKTASIRKEVGKRMEDVVLAMKYIKGSKGKI